ncbi:hypothetical protein LX36DRAFT_670175 [Colletotrichum falcatum]|nr:hypothetical protein LX36DRAFT_670175 [Colletotrichum falcatum]
MPVPLLELVASLVVDLLEGIMQHLDDVLREINGAGPATDDKLHVGSLQAQVAVVPGLDWCADELYMTAKSFWIQNGRQRMYSVLLDHKYQTDSLGGVILTYMLERLEGRGARDKGDNEEEEE